MLLKLVFKNSNSLISNHYNNYSASADDVIEALVGHEVLRRLMMSNIMMDALISSPRFYDHTPKRQRKGCKALATLLKNPRSKLQPLLLKDQ